MSPFLHPCSRLGRTRYTPAKVATLAGAVPTEEEDVLTIRDKLRAAGAGLGIRGKRYRVE